ncbi:MAG: NAD(P)-dependent oxidoreductase [Gammaproteobacteria bacterium]|nr:NAD(P)-dependent oxidoreductase [Gammaproteobacteria bacterium]
MKVLVTGNNGYIGVLLVPMLQQQGHEVVGLDTNYFVECLYDGELPKIRTIAKDLRDVVLTDLDGIEAIIHLAGLSNDPLGDYKPGLTEEINDVASVKLGQLAKKAGVERFIFASSCSNYGAAGDNFLTEEAGFNPVTPYGISKVKVEEGLMLLADNNFCPTYLRASTAYGVSPLLRFDLVVNNLTAWAYTSGLVYLKSDGSPWRPIVHVEDICRAYVAALHAPKETVYNEAFNVGTTTENYQIRELADMVQEIVPNSRIEYAEDAGPDKRCYRVNCNKIATVLHEFKPQWTARRGIEELYETYQRVGLTVDDFEGERYKRIAHIKKLVDQGKLDNHLRWK